MESYIDIVKFAITALIAVFGWLAGHYFSDKRDKSNKKRELITKHLINAYSVLTNEISHRKQTSELQKKLEGIVTEIQLFGSTEQITLAKKLANEVAAGQEFD